MIPIAQLSHSPLPSVDIKSCRESNLKCWLWTQVYGLEIVCHKVSLSSFGNYSTPSISVGRKTAEWQLEVIISASPRPLAIPCVSPSMRQTTAPISIIVRFLFVSFDQWICYENRPYFPFVGVDVHRSGKWSHVARFTFIHEPVRMS